MNRKKLLLLDRIYGPTYVWSGLFTSSPERIRNWKTEESVAGSGGMKKGGRGGWTFAQAQRQGVSDLSAEQVKWRRWSLLGTCFDYW